MILSAFWPFIAWMESSTYLGNEVQICPESAFWPFKLLDGINSITYFGKNVKCKNPVLWSSVYPYSTVKYPDDLRGIFSEKNDKKQKR